MDYCEKSKRIWPLGRSIAIGCFIFTLTLCIILGVTSHADYKRSVLKSYQNYISDIFRYVETAIDHEDLKKCIETGERSEKYNALEKFMDGIKEDFYIHYLYIIKPLNKNPTGNMMSVISAENYYDRYINTEGNLYLGWISYDEFDQEVVKQFFSVMEKRKPVYFEEVTEWGTDYTGAISLCDSKNNAYAVLAVDIDISFLKKQFFSQAFYNASLIVGLGLFFTVIFLIWSRMNIIHPISQLTDSAVSFVQKSHGQRNIEQLKFNTPEIKHNNEIKQLASAIEQMTFDMQDYVVELVSAELDTEMLKKQANNMSELANRDSLTGVKNKTAYDREILKMQYQLETNHTEPFGIAMIDLNYLKKINDTFGHEQGNIAIKKLSNIVCSIFKHSPVFRIGGDEFVIILKETDLSNLDSLTEAYNQQLKELAADNTLEPWEKVSAAMGIAIYDSNIDSSVDSVFKRADQKMYERKKAMKAVREA